MFTISKPNGIILFVVVGGYGSNVIVKYKNYFDFFKDRLVCFNPSP